MNTENLKKSIVLIGPMCVGKSLISSALEQKTNYTRICIDNLFYLAREEYLGEIKPGDKNAQKYKKKRINGLHHDKAYKSNTIDQLHIDEESRLIDCYLEEYKKYRAMFGGLYKFQCVVEDLYSEFFTYVADKFERIYITNKIILKTLDMIFEKTDEPLILDMPAWFGWSISDQELKTNRTLKYRQESVKKLQKAMKEVLKTTKTVLLYPGNDYSKRNATGKDKMNNIILKNLKSYYDCSKVSIDVNGLFNNPENECFKQRWWFDARESLTKQQLKNKGNIANICDEILSQIENLNEMEKQ